MKPVIYAANVADSDLATGNDMSKKVFEFAASEGAKAVLVSAQVRCNIMHAIIKLCGSPNRLNFYVAHASSSAVITEICHASEV